MADEILITRNKKYPPTMKCAGSIFKNLILSELPDFLREVVPAKVIREGKVPSAYFLEEVGAKGLRRGDIHVAAYHATLIYNAGPGAAREVREGVDHPQGPGRRRCGMQPDGDVPQVGWWPEWGGDGGAAKFATEGGWAFIARPGLRPEAAVGERLLRMHCGRAPRCRTR